MSGEGGDNDRERRMRNKEAEAGGQEGDGKVRYANDSSICTVEIFRRNCALKPEHIFGQYVGQIPVFENYSGTYTCCISL